MKQFLKTSVLIIFMTNRFPIEFFQELVKKQVSDSDVTTDFDITLVDGDETEDMNSLDKTVEERVQTQKF